MLNVSKLIKGFNYKGEFLNSNDLNDLLYKQEFITFNELIDWLEDSECSDFISELADSKVDVYYHDLREWSVDNYEYIEEAIAEYGYDYKEFDFHKAIQLGQYHCYNNEFYNMVDEFKKYLESNYKF